MWLEPLKVTSARAYVAVSNLACISGYNKYGDPECGQGSVIYTGLDSGRYPMPHYLLNRSERTILIQLS